MDTVEPRGDRACLQPKNRQHEKNKKQRPDEQSSHEAQEENFPTSKKCQFFG